MTTAERQAPKSQPRRAARHQLAPQTIFFVCTGVALALLLVPQTRITNRALALVHRVHEQIPHAFVHQMIDAVTGTATHSHSPAENADVADAIQQPHQHTATTPDEHANTDATVHTHLHASTALTTTNHADTNHADTNHAEMDHANMVDHSVMQMPQVEPIYAKWEAENVAVEFTVLARNNLIPNAEVAEGEYAAVEFKLSQQHDGKPLTQLRPAAWIDVTPTAAETAATDQPACKARIEGYLSSGLLDRPAIDLNRYFILSLNDDATIAVTDPMVNLGGITQLYKLIQLGGLGADWRMDSAQRKLYVTLPFNGQVAIIDLNSLEVTGTLKAGEKPVRLALAPDEQTLWVTDDSANSAQSGVTVLDLGAGVTAAQIATALGPHDLTFSADGRLLLVTNQAAGTVSLIDTTKQVKLRDLPVGHGPVAVEVAPSGLFYVVSADGTLTVIDGVHQAVTATIKIKPGIATLRFSPDGQWALVTNPATNELYVIQSKAHRLYKTISIAGAPTQILLDETYAYIRSLESNQLTTLALADLPTLTPAQVLTATIGSRQPGDPGLTLGAQALTTTPEQAVLITHPNEQIIYYYLPGSTSAAGSFQGYGRRPLAVQLLDRSLHETNPGLYTGKFRVPAAGDYTVAFLLDSPRVWHCFTFTAKANPTLAATQQAVQPPALNLLQSETPFQPGQPYPVHFTLTDRGSNQPVDQDEVVVVATALADNWSDRILAQQIEPGLYRADLQVPQAGSYQLHFAVLSLQMNEDRFPALILDTVSE